MRRSKNDSRDPTCPAQVLFGIAAVIYAVASLVATIMSWHGPF